MKKFLYLALVIPIVLTSCSKKWNGDEPEPEPEPEIDLFNFETFEEFIDFWDLTPYQSVCTSVTDAFDGYPNSMWSLEYIAIPDEVVLSMSTCGLLETLLTHPANRVRGPWNPPIEFINRYDIPGVDFFNDSLNVNNVAVELFKRDDCFSVMASKYLNVIKEKAETYGMIRYLDMLFASNMCMSAFNEKEKILSVAMALERSRQYQPGYIHILEPCHILAVTMRSCNYTPFLNEFGYTWGQSRDGYDFWGLEDNIITHAKQFLNGNSD